MIRKAGPVTLSYQECLAFLRLDFASFLERAFLELNPEATFLRNWHIDLIAYELELCRRGDTRRLIINLPPRSLKSHIASVAFPAWLLGHDASTQIICASYSQELADKHALDTRNVVTSGFYRELFEPQPLKLAVSEFTTSSGGFRFATSVGGTLTGRGGDIIIIDDPMKGEEALSDTRRTAVNEWFGHTLLSRLNDKFNGCIILIMQRLHEDDLTGHLLKTGGWKMLRLPAIAEEQESHEWVNLMGVRKSFTRQCGEALHVEREPLSVLEEIRKNMGSYNFEGQYQQSPAPPGGGMVRQDWFRRYAAPPAKFDSIFQSWDTANKMSELNDFSVCTTWGVVGKNLYLLNVLRKRLEYPDLKRAVCSQAQAFSAVTVLIEDKASGTQLIQELKREDLCNVRGYNSTLDKQMRLVSVTSTIENGFVYLPEKAAWLDDYLHEMILFPRGNFDDQVDSTSQALLWIRENRHPYGLLAWYEALASKTAVSEMQERLFTRRYI